MNKPPAGKVDFKMFRGTLASWNQLFTKASEFANTQGTDRIISISHSSDHGEGVVVVWYFNELIPPDRPDIKRIQ